MYLENRTLKYMKQKLREPEEKHTNIKLQSDNLPDIGNINKDMEDLNNIVSLIWRFYIEQPTKQQQAVHPFQGVQNMYQDTVYSGP